MLWACAPFRDRARSGKWPSVASGGCGERQIRPINLELIAAHTVIGADQLLLQVANGAVRQRHCGFRAFADVDSQWLIARHMLETSPSQSAEALRRSVYRVAPGATFCVRTVVRVALLKSGITASKRLKQAFG